MSEIDRLQDAFMKADALAQQGDAQAKQDAAMFAAEIRRLQASGGSNSPEIMPQLNAGIAETAGGLVDFLNPFDKPHALNPFKEGTGSAREGLTNVMEAGGVRVAKDDPDGVLEGLARGTGRAAAGVVPAGVTANTLRGAGGMIGAIADDAVPALTSRAGIATELAAGGIGGAASEGVEAAGGPQWLQDTAEVAVPMAALPLAQKFSPTGYIARKGVDAASKALAPYTERGAMGVAKERAQTIAGGANRAEELANSIGRDNPIGLSPAQQTGDEGLIALEQLTARNNPELRERLQEQLGLSTNKAVEGVNIGADPDEARTFFERRVDGIKKGMQDRIKRMTQMGDEALEEGGPRAAESTNSEETVEKLKRALQVELAEEKRLWDRIDRSTPVEPRLAKDAAAEYLQNLPEAQRADFPVMARELLDGNLSDVDTVNGLHGLYSELRRVARSAMAGNDQNKNKARIANGIADEILEDLAQADNLPDGVGAAISEARAFSRSLHETFDRGAVGKVLKRTLDGDEVISTPEALQNTVGRGRTGGSQANREIIGAAPDARGNVQDYMRGEFLDKVLPNGKFSPAPAAAWLRRNRELLSQYPELRAEFGKAMRNRQAAADFEANAPRREKAIDKSASAKFIEGTPEQAVDKILNAAKPRTAARQLVKQAQKDRSGAALDGVRGAFSRKLISGVVNKEGNRMSGAKLIQTLNENNDALKEIYSPKQMKALRRIAAEAVKLDRAMQRQGGIGDTIAEAFPNSGIEFLIRSQALRAASAVGPQGPAQLQFSAMASNRMKRILDRLSSDKATQILEQAIEDPELMKRLLRSQPPEEVVNSLAPYFAGGMSNVMAEEE